jgi:hypothetical protein
VLEKVIKKKRKEKKKNEIVTLACATYPELVNISSVTF